MIEWFATGLNILGAVLNAYKIVWCWPIWATSSIIWLTIAVGDSREAQIVLWGVFLGTNLFGWWKWTMVPKFEICASCQGHGCNYCGGSGRE